MITNYVSKREISLKRRCSCRFVGSPSTANETSPFTPPCRLSMPRSVGVVFTDSLVAFHAAKQQSRRYEFYHHHLGERAVVHLAYGNESTRSHNHYHQSFQYCPHNPVSFWLSIAAVGGIAPPTSEAIQRSVFYIAELHGIRT